MNEHMRKNNLTIAQLLSIDIEVGVFMDPDPKLPEKKQIQILKNLDPDSQKKFKKLQNRLEKTLHKKLVIYHL